MVAFPFPRACRSCLPSEREKKRFKQRVHIFYDVIISYLEIFTTDAISQEMLLIRVRTDDELVRVDVKVSGQVSERQVRVIASANDENEARDAIDADPLTELELCCSYRVDCLH